MNVRIKISRKLAGACSVNGIQVDAIELRHSIRFRDCLDGWDCVFVMNPVSVEEVVKD